MIHVRKTLKKKVLKYHVVTKEGLNIKHFFRHLGIHTN